MQPPRRAGNLQGPLSPPLTPVLPLDTGAPHPHKWPWVRELQDWHTSGNRGTASCTLVAVLSSLPAGPQTWCLLLRGAVVGSCPGKRAAQEALCSRTEETPRLPLCDFRGLIAPFVLHEAFCPASPGVARLLLLTRAGSCSAETQPGPFSASVQGLLPRGVGPGMDESLGQPFLDPLPGIAPQANACESDESVQTSTSVRPQPAFPHLPFLPGC